MVVVIFLEAGERFIQVISQDISRHVTNADSFNAIRVTQKYFDHNALLWVAREL
jgi:hypothetical protein